MQWIGVRPAGCKGPMLCQFHDVIMQEHLSSIAGIEADRFQSNPCTSISEASRWVCDQLVARVPMVPVS